MTCRSISNIGPDFESLVRPLDPPGLESLPTASDDVHAFVGQEEQPLRSSIPTTTTATNLITSIYVLVSSSEIRSSISTNTTESAESNISRCVETARHSLDSISHLIASAPSSLTAPLTPFDMVDAIFMSSEQKLVIRLELQKAAIKMASFACRCYVINWLTSQIQHIAQVTSIEVIGSSMFHGLDTSLIEKDDLVRKASNLIKEETRLLIGELARFLRGLDIQHCEPHAMSLVSTAIIKKSLLAN
jgi:hypothetical protein